jgi:hypothetical protein
MDGNRIDKLLVTHVPPAPDEQDADEHARRRGLGRLVRRSGGPALRRSGAPAASSRTMLPLALLLALFLFLLDLLRFLFLLHRLRRFFFGRLLCILTLAHGMAPFVVDIRGPAYYVTCLGTPLIFR